MLSRITLLTTLYLHQHNRAAQSLGHIRRHHLIQRLALWATEHCRWQGEPVSQFTASQLINNILSGKKTCDRYHLSEELVADLYYIHPSQ